MGCDEFWLVNVEVPLHLVSPYHASVTDGTGLSAVCSCEQGFLGAQCQSVTCGRSSCGQNCSFRDRVRNASYEDIYNPGACVCNTGFDGPSCQYSDAATCNGLGQVRQEGMLSTMRQLRLG